MMILQFSSFFLHFLQIHSRLYCVPFKWQQINKKKVTRFLLSTIFLSVFQKSFLWILSWILCHFIPEDFSFFYRIKVHKKQHGILLNNGKQMRKRTNRKKMKIYEADNEFNESLFPMSNVQNEDDDVSLYALKMFFFFYYWIQSIILYKSL